MVNANSTTAKKSEKVPASKIIKPKDSQVSSVHVSPGGSYSSLEEEVTALRARNRTLTHTLKAIKDTAAKEEKRLYDLVWFARNRSRYPNHESRHRIQNAEEYQDELAKLMTGEADFHHGMHTGLLAASRLFKDYADILHINDHTEVTGDLLGAFGEHMKKVEESHKNFPEVEADQFPNL